MKRIFTATLLFILTCIVPMLTMSAQDQKEEKKIRIVVDDGSGSRTVLDTVIADIGSTGRIQIKDGTIVFIGKPEMDVIDIPDGKKIMVTVESDGDGKKQIEKSVHIASADSQTWTVSSDGEKGYVYVLSKDKSKGEEGGKHIIITSPGDKGAEWEGKDSGATKYVVAKDGVVVTVETDDEAKARDIIKLVQDKLGVKSEEKK